MIKFFRRIRRNLLSEGKTGKYLKYAIGEVLLVVIGILIALQINNWNQSRLDREVEKTTLLSLKADLSSALTQLNAKIDQNRRYRVSDSTAFHLIHNRIKIPQDSLTNLLLRHVYTPGFDPELGTLNEILNTGKMDVIRNDSIRNIISSWNMYMDELQEVEEVLIYLDNEFKTPLYMKTLPYAEGWDYTAWGSTQYKAEHEKNFYTLEFENLMYNYMLYGNIQSMRFNFLKRKIQSMLLLIENELKK